MRRISASLMLVILLISLFPLLLITIYSPGSYVFEGMTVLINDVSYAVEEFLVVFQTRVLTMNFLSF